MNLNPVTFQISSAVIRIRSLSDTNGSYAIMEIAILSCKSRKSVSLSIGNFMLHLVAGTDIVLLINNMLPSKTILLPTLAQVLRLGWGLPFWRLIFVFDAFSLFLACFCSGQLILVATISTFLV